MEDQVTYHSTVRALRDRLNCGIHSLAALDFLSEIVSDFLRWLEHIYQLVRKEPDKVVVTCSA